MHGCCSPGIDEITHSRIHTCTRAHSLARVHAWRTACHCTETRGACTHARTRTRARAHDRTTTRRTTHDTSQARKARTPRPSHDAHNAHACAYTLAHTHTRTDQAMFLHISGPGVCNVRNLRDEEGQDLPTEFLRTMASTRANSQASQVSEVTQSQASFLFERTRWRSGRVMLRSMQNGMAIAPCIDFCCTAAESSLVKAAPEMTTQSKVRVCSGVPVCTPHVA